MYYSGAMGGWQLIEERIDEGYASSPGVNRVAQEVWGLRYIDDAVMRINNAADEAQRLRFYHLTDVQFSTVAMIGLGGTYPPLMERVMHDPYGRATHRWAGDVNNDGAVDSTDAGLVKDTLGNVIGDTGYDVRMDFDRDGDIDSDDKDIADAALERAALMAGEISDRAGPDNVFGYDGYVFAPETQRYCVRFRWYDPVIGRWMERDARYSDSFNLLEFCRSASITRIDPAGKVSLWLDDPPEVDLDELVRKTIQDSKRLNAQEKKVLKDVTALEMFCLESARISAIGFFHTSADPKNQPFEQNRGRGRYKGTLIDGPGDAVRHCTWACMSRKCWSKAKVKALLDAHESEHDAKDPEGKDMDTHNNDVGLEIWDFDVNPALRRAESEKKKVKENCTLGQSGEPDYGNLCKEGCEQALDKGGLKVLPRKTWHDHDTTPPDPGSWPGRK